VRARAALPFRTFRRILEYLPKQPSRSCLPGRTLMSWAKGSCPAGRLTEIAMTPEQVIARLNQLRKEFDDDKENEDYFALRHALLFISYQMATFKTYMQEASKK